MFDAFTGDKVHFTIADISSLRKGAFSRDASCTSWACNTATKTSDGRTFTVEWRKHLGLKLSGVIGKTDYAPCGYHFKKGSWVKAMLWSLVTDNVVNPRDHTKVPEPPVLSEGSKWSTE